MRLSDRTKYYIGATAVIAVALTAGPALAQQSGGMDRIVDVYKDGANAWGPSLRNYALALFGLLATIEWVWSFARLAIKGADAGEFMSEVFTRVMFIGFFYWLMIGSAEIAPAVVNSFREAGNTAAQAAGGSGGMRPSDIWKTGVEVANAVMATETGLDVGKAVGIFLSGLILIVCFALMAAAMIITLVEGYIIMNAGILLMGFGGSRWTKDIAVKTLTYAVSVGAKLFVIQILVGMAEAMVTGWTQTLGTGAGMSPDYMGEILEIVGASIVMLALTFSIPNIVQGIVNGSSPGSHNALTGAAAAVAGAVGGGLAVAAGGFMAAGGAAKLATEQLKSADAAGTGPTTGLGRAGAFIGGAGANLGKSAMADVGARLSGRVRSGNAPARMGASMMDEAKSLQTQRGAPAAPMASAGAAPAPAMASAGGDAGEAGSGGGAAGSIRPEAPTEGGSGDPIRGAAPTPEPQIGASAGAGDQPKPYEATYGATYGGSYGQADPEVGGAKATAAAAAAPQGAAAGLAGSAATDAAAQMTAATVEGAGPSATPTTAGQALQAGAAMLASSSDGADQMTGATIEGAAATEGPGDASPTGARTIAGAAVTPAPTGADTAPAAAAGQSPADGGSSSSDRTIAGAPATPAPAGAAAAPAAPSATAVAATASQSPTDGGSSGGDRTIAGAPATPAPAASPGPAKALGGALGRGTGARTPPKKP